MSDTPTPNHNLLSVPPSGGFSKALYLTGVSLVMMGVMLTTGAYVWAQGYNDRIPPNVFIGDIALGGLDPDHARILLQERIDEIVTGGLSVRVEGELKSLSLVTLVTTDLIEDAEFFVDETLDTLMNFHGATPYGNTLRMLELLFEPVQANMFVSVNEEQIHIRILELFPEAETLATSASFIPTLTSDGWAVQIQEGEVGHEFQWDAFFEELHENLIKLDAAMLDMNLIDQEPHVNIADAQAQIQAAELALDNAPYTVQLSSESATWQLTADELSEILLPGNDGDLALHEELLGEWTQTIQNDINQPAIDARLELTDGRVTDFVESSDGRSVAIPVLTEDLLEVIRTASAEPVELVIVVEHPSTTVADINNLGITQILGTGTSSYRGSPWNRRQNIQNGVDLLNGLLIGPGETFSLIDALSPFTTANGYLPELVIKGDSIEPEIGGGLCQIGTTTFRATMNAGLAVAERRNHSLVVSYYNDPSNGLPGTDATIYEPAPDYKLTNDTDSYVLFQAENLTDTQDLRFTFWGTSDGRQGSYSPPVVSRWIPVGEDTIIETEDLEPGQEECQEAHIGADSSFTYTVAMPDGEIKEKIFESHYRPLPRICLVGVDPDALKEDEQTQEDDVEQAKGEQEEDPSEPVEDLSETVE